MQPARDEELAAVATLVAVTFENEPYVRATLGRGDGVALRLRALLELQLRDQYLPHGASTWPTKAMNWSGRLWAPSDADAAPVVQAGGVRSYLRVFGRRRPRRSGRT